MAFNGGASVSDYRGLKVLQGQLVTVYTAPTSAISCPDACYTNSAKQAALRRGISSPDVYRTGFNDLFQVVAATTDLTAGQIDTVTFALIAGETFAGIQSSADAALEAYIDTILLGEVPPPPPPPPLPGTFALHQNYPNPFNEGTMITFDLTTQANYVLGIYNMLGQKVREIGGRGGPGMVEVPITLNGLSTGIYLYKVKAQGHTDSRKMLFLK